MRVSDVAACARATQACDVSPFCLFAFLGMQPSRIDVSKFSPHTHTHTTTLDCWDGRSGHSTIVSDCMNVRQTVFMVTSGLNDGDAGNDITDTLLVVNPNVRPEEFGAKIIP